MLIFSLGTLHTSQHINTPTAEICSLPVRNIFCPAAVVTHLWVYNKSDKLCHILGFFTNCLPRQLNMFDTEEACMRTCGRSDDCGILLKQLKFLQALNQKCILLDHPPPPLPLSLLSHRRLDTGFTPRHQPSLHPPPHTLPAAVSPVPHHPLHQSQQR